MYEIIFTNCISLCVISVITTKNEQTYQHNYIMICSKEVKYQGPAILSPYREVVLFSAAILSTIERLSSSLRSKNNEGTH